MGLSMLLSFLCSLKVIDVFFALFALLLSHVTFLTPFVPVPFLGPYKICLVPNHGAQVPHESSELSSSDVTRAIVAVMLLSMRSSAKLQWNSICVLVNSIHWLDMSHVLTQ